MTIDDPASAEVRIEKGSACTVNSTSAYSIKTTKRYVNHEK